MGGHVGAPHLDGVVGGSRPADDQRSHPWRRLRADRPRLHDGVRHHRADQLRPRRRLHAGPLRLAQLVHAARGDEDADGLAARDDSPTCLSPHDAHDRGPQRRDRPRGLPAAAALDPARAAHHGDRRVVHARERGAPLEGPGAHRLPRRLPIRGHPARVVRRGLGHLRHDQGPARGGGDDPADAGPPLLREPDHVGQGHARDRPGPRDRRGDGDQRRADYLDDVLHRRGARRSGRAHPGHVLQHRPVVDGLPGRAQGLHRGRARRHRQHDGRRARRSVHRIPVSVERPVHLRPLDQRDRFRDPHPRPRLPSPRPHGRTDAREDMRRGLPWTALLVALILYPFVDRALGFQTVHAVSDGMIYVLLALGLNIVVGYAGLLDLGYAAFFAIGAYSMGLLNSPVLGSPLYGHAWSFWVCIWIAAAVSALLGVAIGAPTLRVRGDYLAIITLGFGEIIPVAIRNLGDVTIEIGSWRPIERLNLTGGENGVNPVGRPYLPGVPFETDPVPWYFLILVIGGAGSLKGVILGGMLITLFDRVVLTQTTFMVRALGRTLGVSALATADLTLWRWFFFGLGLVLVMVLRPQGLGGRRLSPAPIADDAEDPTSPDVASAPRVDAIPGWLRERARRGVAASPAILDVRGVTKRFGGVIALNEIDLVVPHGAIIGLIGPNGAGKTTFFSVVTGLVRPDAGRITFDGANLVGLRPNAVVARGIARTFQSIRLFQNMTVLENALVGEHCRLTATVPGAVLRPPAVIAEEARAHARARELLEFVGLGGKEHELARNLSDGDQRRLEIARALATEPRLLLLDEPSAGMNPREAETLTDLIGLLRRELALSVLLIEHHMEVVMGISDRITVLDYGTRIAEGPPAAIQRDARVIEAYLATGYEQDLASRTSAS